MERDTRLIPLFLSVVLVFGAWVCPLSAQSSLERLEQQIRQRNPQTSSAEKAADSSSAGSSVTMKAAVGGEVQHEPVYVGLVGDDQNDRGRGVRVLIVHPGGPAEKAGIRSQDLITSMTGIRIRQMSDLSDILETFSPGQTTSIEVLRDNKKVSLKLVFGQRPAGNRRIPGATSSETPQSSNVKSSEGKEPTWVVPSPPPELLPEPPEQLSGPILETPKEKTSAGPSKPSLSKPTQSKPSLPETVEQPVNTTAEVSQPGLSSQESAKRIEQLQHRVAELEQRIAELERALADAKKGR